MSAEPGRPTGRAVRERLLSEPRRPPAIREWRGALWLAVGAVCVGAFMGQLDASIVTVALPSLQRAFSTSIGAVTWVALSYLVTLVALVTSVGRFADMVGRKLLYTYGFVVFIVGSAACGLAPSLGALIAFRVLQAVGAAMLQANSVAIITTVAPRTRLARAIGIQGAAQALGLALGPSIGGLLLSAGGWRLIFLVNIPFGLLGAAVGWVFIPRSRHLQERTAFDWLGVALFVPATVTLLSAISLGNSAGWDSTLVIACFSAAAVLAVAFIAREQRTRSPMIALALFRRLRFSAGVSSGLLSYLVLFGVLFVVPFFFERGLGQPPSRSGLQLMAMPFALGLVAPFAGRLADRLGSRGLTVAGMILVSLGLVALGTFHADSAVVIGELAVVGIGLGTFTPPNNAAIMASVPRAEAGMASGILNTTRGFGTALGLALTAFVFGLAGGDTPVAETAVHAFSIAVYFLAGLALLSAAVAALRGGIDTGGEPVPEVQQYG